MTRLRAALATWWISLRDSIAKQSQFILPAIVVGVALWRFAQIPVYQTPALPADWTPGCPEWTLEWRSVESAPTGAIPHLTGYADERFDDRAMPLTYTWRTPRQRQYLTVDVTTGKILTQSAVLPGIGQEVRLPNGLIRSIDSSAGSWPIIVWREEATGDVLRQITLNYPELSLQMGQVIRVMFLMETANGECRGILRLSESQPNAGHKELYFWFSATSDGTITRFRQLPAGRLPTTGWPMDDPQVVLLRASTVDREIVSAVELATGDEVPLPNDLPPLLTMPRHRHEDMWPTPPGWSPVIEDETRPALPHLHIRTIHPTVFQEHGPGPDQRDGIRAVANFLGDVRAGFWRALYSPEKLKRHALQAYQYHQVWLCDPTQPEQSRMLTGNVVTALQSQPVWPEDRIEVALEELHQSNAMVYPLPANVWRYARSGRSLLQLQQLAEGHFLILQAIEDVPAGITTAPAILRLGLLPPAATEPEWLGWIPLEASNRQVFHMPQLIFGNQTMLCSYRRPQGARTQHVRQQTYEIRWAVLPIPDQLRELMATEP